MYSASGSGLPIGFPAAWFTNGGWNDDGARDFFDALPDDRQRYLLAQCHDRQEFLDLVHAEMHKT